MRNKAKFNEGDIVRLANPMYGEFVGEMAVVVKVATGGLAPAYTVRLCTGVEVVVDELTVEGVTLDELRRTAGDKVGPSWRTIIDDLPEGDEEARQVFQKAVKSAEEEEYQKELLEATEAFNLGQATLERLLLAVVPGSACGIAILVVLILAGIGKLTTFGIVLGFVCWGIAAYLIGDALVPMLIIARNVHKKKKEQLEELKNRKRE